MASLSHFVTLLLLVTTQIMDGFFGLDGTQVFGIFRPTYAFGSDVLAHLWAP